MINRGKNAKIVKVSEITSKEEESKTLSAALLPAENSAFLTKTKNMRYDVQKKKERKS